MSRLFPWLAATLLVAACAHPLEGRIWSSRDSRFVDEPALVRALQGARYRALGERHDNPAHHALRARLIQALGRDARRAPVIFEQLDLGTDAELARAQAQGGDAEALADAGRLDRKGWRWPLHKPLLEAAISAGMPVRAGNLAREAAREIARGTRTPDLAGAPWTEAQDAALRKDLSDAHCKPPPESLLRGMVLAQRARDAAMAQALRAAGPGAILIAGNGHVRRDIGAPALLGPEALGVAFVEVQEGDVEPAAYGPYDYLWFTAALQRPDPCAAQ